MIARAADDMPLYFGGLARTEMSFESNELTHKPDVRLRLYSGLDNIHRIAREPIADASQTASSNCSQHPQLGRLA